MADSIGTAFVDVAFDPKQIEGQLGGLGAKTSGAFGKLGNLAGTAMVGGIGVAVAAGVAAGKYLYDVGEQFDAMADTIRVATGKTGKDLDSLVDTAKKVGTDVPASFEDAGKAVSTLSTRLGLTGKPLRTVSDQMLELARLSGTDLPTALNSVTRMLGDAGFKGAEASEGIDKLWRAAQATQVPVTRLSDLLTKFGGPMRQLGFSFEEQAALLGKFEKEGVNTELVMGSMRIALGKMAKAGKEPVQALRETMKAIRDTGDAGDANRKAIELFGARAGPDMAAAIREGRFSIDDLVKRISKGRETVMKASADTRDFSEEWLLFKNRVAVAVAPAATKMFAAIGQGMAELNKQSPAITKALSKELAPALKDLGPLFSDLKKLIVDLTPVWKVLGVVIEANVKIWVAQLKGFVDVVGGLVKILRGLLEGDWRLAWEGAKQVVDGATAQIRAQVQGIVNVLGAVVGPIKTQAVAIGKAIYDGLVDGVRPIAAAVTTTFNTVTSTISGALGAVRTAATAVGTAIKTGVESGVTGIGAFVSSTFSGAVAIVNAAVSGARTAASAVGTAIKTGVETGLTGVGAFVSSAFTAMAGIIRGVLGAVTSAANAVGGAIKNGVEGGVSGLASAVSGVLSKIAGTISGFVGRITSAAHSIGSAIFQGIMGSVGDIAGAVWSVLNRVYQTILGWVNKIRSAASGIGSAIGSVIPGMAPAPPAEGGTQPQARAGVGAPVASPLGRAAAPQWSSGPAVGGTMYGARSPFDSFTRSLQRSTAAAVGAVAPAPTFVRVFIGDEELRGIVRTEVGHADDATARIVLSGMAR